MACLSYHGCLRVNNQQQQAMIDALSAIKGPALSMPMAKRGQLKETEAFREAFMGQWIEVINHMALHGRSAHQIMGSLTNEPSFVEILKKKKLSTSSIITLMMMCRHIQKKAPILTVNPHLDDLLEDTGIKNNIPSQFFAPPYPECFVEFDPAENRSQSRHKTYSGNMVKIIEGAFVQETRFDRLPNVSMRTREHLELDPNASCRMIEVGFSISPVDNAQAIGTSMPVAYDAVNLMTIYIQDEQEPISEVLDRHLALHSINLGESLVNSDQDSDAFAKEMKESFAYLSKVLFYLNVEKGNRKHEPVASSLEERIKKTAPKKQDKLKRQLTRSYDRIVIGPESYTPLSKQVGQVEVLSGSKAPHFRRGYFGIRWKGAGENKKPELVRVSHTIINEHLLTNRGKMKKNVSAKSYLIK